MEAVSDELKAARVRLPAFVFSVHTTAGTVKNSNLVLFSREVRLKPTYNSQFGPLNAAEIVEALTQSPAPVYFLKLTHLFCLEEPPEAPVITPSAVPPHSAIPFNLTGNNLSALPQRIEPFTNIATPGFNTPHHASPALHAPITVQGQVKTKGRFRTNGMLDAVDNRNINDREVAAIRREELGGIGEP